MIGWLWVPLFVGLLFGTGCGGDDDDDSLDAAGGADAPTSADANAVSDATPIPDSPSSTTCEDDYTDITGECDLFLQDCQDGFWCKVISTPNAVATCVEDGTGTVDKGGTCDSGSECLPGLICAAGHCTPFCCPSTDVPCGSGTCDEYVWYGGPTYAIVCSY